jgi:putative membrane protein
MLYEILKALHIIAVIAWMAGLLYLPRLFVYHADAEKGSKQSETFKIMERRLMRGFVHHLFGRWRKAFEADRNTRPASYYRWWNEVPTVLMIAIVFLAVLKPF